MAKPTYKKPKEVKDKTPAATPEAVSLIDRIPSTKMNTERLAQFCRVQLDAIMADRSVYMKRREMYIDTIDNFIDYDLGTRPFDGASEIHIPVIMEKVRATHARLYQALFSMSPPFYIEPQEKLDTARIYKIAQLMKWALTRYVNYYKGVNEAIDDAVWGYAAEGWCFLHARWDHKMRKAVVVDQEIQVPKEKALREPPTPINGKLAVTPPIKFVEREQWITEFSGPLVENVLPEHVYMPGYGDIQKVPLVGFKTTLRGHDLKYYSMTKFFDAEAVKKAMDFPNGVYSEGVESNIKTLKSENQGVRDNRTKASVTPYDASQEYDVYQCYATVDGDGDGFNEELVIWYHRNSNTVLRWTYLDRITKTGRRPVYTAGYIRRPGRNYHIGLCELLYCLNKEVDTIHNQRVDFGTISNMPFFFYQALSSFPNERIQIAPGRGIPVDDVNQVLFPQIKGGTQFGFQEEQGLVQIINRVSSISDINVGQPNSAEMLRTQGGVAALLQEGNAPLDISLRRLQDMYSMIIGDIHQMISEKLPAEFQHLVVGDDGQPIFDSQGNPLFSDPIQSRQEISGKVHFHLRANSSAGNRSLMRQSRSMLFQQLMNPINLQMGIVGPQQVYEMNKALIEVSDEPDPKRYIMAPANAPKPLSVEDELGMLRQGLMPEIPYNDDHKTKIEILQTWISSPEVQQGIQIGNVNPMAPLMTQMAIKDHMSKMQSINAQQAQLQNMTGSQLPMAPNVGAMSTQGMGPGAIQPPGQGMPPEGSQIPQP